MNEPQSELERIVARLLPEIVAEQLAALNPQPVWDAVPGRPAITAKPAAHHDRVPDWYREAGAAAAEYASELTGVEFDPEAREVTSEMRHFHRTAVDARDQAMQILGDAGRRDKSKDVYAAIGRGREALIRLGALRAGRPVPLRLFTPDELTGAPDTSQSPHTGRRFHWKGTGSSEFLFDRPHPGEPALVAVTNSRAGMELRHMRRTEDTIAQLALNFVGAEQLQVVVVGTSVTHLKCDPMFRDVSWTVHVIDPRRLPALTDKASGSKSAIYRYDGGRRKVVLQSLADITATLYPPDLKPQELASFRGETRATIDLPASPGVLKITTTDRWSIDPAPKDRKR
ncbi:hypothetical protein [Actinospica robiniae]|uniref:hypothetical protein n=1 Tax=Actinospica robiniae TaxID=304901 RepID=UPI0012F769CF|nr:hypothetical protein [Actinospica robiniae]